MKTLSLDFVITPSDHGPLIRVAVDHLARTTGLECAPHYGLDLLDRDLAVATAALAGAAVPELRAIGAAFERARPAQAAPRESATMPALAPIAPVIAMRPATAHPAPARPEAPQAPVSETQAAFYAQEKALIVDALNRVAWTKVRAAKMLGMARRTFYRRMTEYGLMEAAEAAVESAAPEPEAPVHAAPIDFRRKPGRRRKMA